MKKQYITFLLCLLCISLFAQEETAQEYIDKGITYHDQGDYDKAIEAYKKALEIDPNSSIAYYEISFSYFGKQDYKKAEEYGKKSIALDDKNLVHSYITLGNALDMQGKSKEALKIYEKALKKFNHPLLNYNYAVTLYDEKQFDKAYTVITEGIAQNPNHPTSHILLSDIMAKKGNRIKAVLPLYYFLMLEPATERSERQYQRLQNYLSQGVSASDTGIDITINPAEDDFSAAEMMMSMVKASNSLEENKDKTALELFAENNASIFSILGELRDDKKGFWWDVYVDPFYSLTQDNLIPVFSYYISFTQGEAATQWLTSHEEDYNRFKNWFAK